MSIDRAHTGPCRHHSCPHRAVRAGVCLTHWRALNGTAPGPWPEDIEPTTRLERWIRKYGPWDPDREPITEREKLLHAYAVRG